jgi:haloalkane dehalogenase
MGHDWGGPIGMKLAIDEMERIRALVMANTWYWPTTALHLKAFSWVLSTGYLRGLVHKKNLFVEKMIPLGVKHPLAGEVLQHYRGPFQTVDSRAGIAEFARQLTLSANWLGQIEMDVRRKLSQLPLLLTWGIDDLAFTPAFMDTFLRDFTDASAVRLDAKHYVQEDAPGELANAIEDFLST